MLAITRAVDKQRHGTNRAQGLRCNNRSPARRQVNSHTSKSLPLARWFSSILVVNILWRTFLFGLVVLAFRILEQAVEDYSRQGNVKGITDFFTQSLSPLVLVEVGWIFIGMFGFCLIAEYCRLLGGDLVWKVMTHQRIERRESGQ